MDVRDREPAVAPVVAAGVLLAARALGTAAGLSMPSPSAIVEATRAGRSRAYEMRDEVLGLLPSLSRPPGRPPAAPEPLSPDVAYALRGDVLGFVNEHPGCAQRVCDRGAYSEIFRRFILERLEHHADLALPAFADAVRVPLGTLEGWLKPGASCEHAGVDQDSGATSPAAADAEQDAQDARVAKVETLLSAWRNWEGKSLGAFSEHVRRDLRLNLGDGLIAKLLHDHGVRTPKRRGGRSPDEEALRGTFQTFFPGAQWVGDGTEVKATIDGVSYTVNLELMVDAHTAAWTGIHVSDAEDSDAVALSFEQGVKTTGEPPLAVLLDNKPCNHTESVDAALDETLRIRSTKGRAQNKAHCEGAFGLFFQRAPAIDISTADPHALARLLVWLVATTFARGINHRPRKDRDGKTRAELYTVPVTPEQREEAHDRLRERLRKQERARQTRAARIDPVARRVLDDAFEQLRLDDPERHFRDAIARYSIDAVIDAIGTFRGKREARTLPEGADARYLLGIVRNLVHVHESELITMALLDERIAARDRAFDLLRARREEIANGAGDDAAAQLRPLVGEAMSAERSVDRYFWLDVIADLVASHDDDRRRGPLHQDGVAGTRYAGGQTRHPVQGERSQAAAQGAQAACIRPQGRVDRAPCGRR